MMYTFTFTEPELHLIIHGLRKYRDGLMWHGIEDPSRPEADRILDWLIKGLKQGEASSLQMKRTLPTKHEGC